MLQGNLHYLQYHLFSLVSIHHIISLPLILYFHVWTKQTPLSSRFKILWLTLCQPHNPMEIEVSVFVDQYVKL